MKKFKGIAALLAAAVISLTSAFTAVSGSAAEYFGDVNEDGDITVSDVVELQKYLVKNGDLSSGAIKKADLNNDGKVNVFDLIILKRTVLGIVEKIEIPQPQPQPTTTAPAVTTVPVETTVTMVEIPTEQPSETIVYETAEPAVTTEPLETTVTMETDPVETTTVIEVTTEAVTAETETTETSTTPVQVTTVETETTEVTTTPVQVTTAETETTEVTTTPIQITTAESASTEVSQVTTISSVTVSEDTTKTTADLSENKIAGTDVNRAAVVASFNNNSSLNFWNQSQFESNAESTTGNLIPEITGDGQYTVRLVIDEEGTISALGVRLFAKDGSGVLSSQNHANLQLQLDSIIIDGEDAVLAEGKTLADASVDLSAGDGATIYIAPWYGESLISTDTKVQQYIEITFTVSGLDSAAD